MKFSTLRTVTAVIGGFSLQVSAAPAPSAASAANPTASDPASVHKAQATALTLSPTSHVKGKSFDRYVSIWFENTDYDMAAADREFLFPSFS
jgi:acid phosphatase